MAKYFVRDSHGYVTVIKAGRYTTNQQTGAFEFLNGEVRAASFPCNTTISVVEADAAFQDIYPNDELGTEEETDDVCLDFQLENFLNSEEFADAVAETAAGVVEEYCDPCAPPILTVLQAVDKVTEAICYGYITPEGRFINHSTAESANSGLALYLIGDTIGWTTVDPSKFTFTEVENG